MKQIIWILLAIVIIAVIVKVQKNNNYKENQFSDTQSQEDSFNDSNTIVDGIYSVSKEDTFINWLGQKTLIASWKDTGTIDVSGGNLTVADGIITGEITIDMESIKPIATGKGDGESTLENHLKSDAFFDVENYPTASFVIKSTLPREGEENIYTVTGDLTMKETTNEISFPARIAMKDGSLIAQAEFSVDRTLWDVRFGSTKFFNDLGDNVVDDMIQISFNLIANQ